MGEVIRITPEVAVPVAELEFRASRSSGPGGQGVNTTDSRVELRFDVAGSPSLSRRPASGPCAASAPGSTRAGSCGVVAQAQRSQLANRRAATERFAELMANALATPRPRRPTRPSAASAARRVEGKRRRSAVKRLRGRPPGPED
jgi:ribosome-associated protein